MGIFELSTEKWGMVFASGIEWYIIISKWEKVGDRFLTSDVFITTIKIIIAP
jgi:hypothetical protein